LFLCRHCLQNRLKHSSLSNPLFPTKTTNNATLEEVTALPSCDVSLVDLHLEHLKKFVSFCAGVWGISSRNYAEKKNYENDEQNENTAVRQSFGKKKYIKRANQECLGLPPPFPKKLNATEEFQKK